MSNQNQMATTQMQQLPHWGPCSKNNYYKWEDDGMSRDAGFPGGPAEQHPLHGAAAKPQIAQKQPDWFMFMNTALTRWVIVLI